MKTLLTSIIVLLVFIVLQNQLIISPLFLRNSFNELGDLLGDLFTNPYFVKGIFTILVGYLAFQFINGLLGGDKKRNQKDTQ